MKFITSLLFTMTLTTYAGSIQLEFSKDFYKYKEKIKTRLIEKYKVPESLIEIKLINKCVENKLKNKVVLCFENKKGPKIYSDPNIIKSLLVFGDL